MSDTTTSDLPRWLQGFTARYRAALLTRAGILGLLSAALVIVLAWRLRLWNLPALWSVAVSAALSAAAVVSLGWWLRRRWIAPRHTAAHVDRVLGLQQRLVTAAEFAGSKEAPALYPLLLEDTAKRCSTGLTRLPKPVDRTTGLLLVVLLLLLVLPRLQATSMHPPGEVPPAQPPSAPEPDSPAATSPEQERETPRDRNAVAQRPSAPQPSQPQSGSGTTPTQDGQTSRSPQGSDGNTGQGQQESESSTAHDGADGQGTGETQSPSGAAQDKAAPSGGGGGSRHADHERRDGQDQAQRQAGGNGAVRQGDQGSAQEGVSADETKGRSHGERSSKSQDASQQGGASDGSAQESSDRQGASQPRQGTGAGSMQPQGDQQALKADIQALLKEVSAELKQLQEQLDASSPQAQPQAGSGSDPNLYEAPTKPERASGAKLPVQLGTDTAPVSAKRRGGGIGTAAAEASQAAPTTAAEEAQLSDQPEDEAPTSHQPVPPEYRSVFDRLRAGGADQRRTGEQ